MRLRGENGQATVELVAMIPFVVLLALVAMHALAARGAADMAEHGALAGARALGRDADPRAAVREALPDWAEERVGVAVDGRRVTVRLRPRALVRAIGERLGATARADAGPGAPGSAADWDAVRGGDGVSARPREKAR